MLSSFHAMVVLVLLHCTYLILTPPIATHLSPISTSDDCCLMTLPPNFDCVVRLCSRVPLITTPFQQIVTPPQQIMTSSIMMTRLQLRRTTPTPTTPFHFLLLLLLWLLKTWCKKEFESCNKNWIRIIQLTSIKVRINFCLNYIFLHIFRLNKNMYHSNIKNYLEEISS